ncbi:MAG: FAD-dependent thymidylate synthase [Nanoarchaeota archaeon]
MIETEIILDSINTSGNRLTTWKLTYPRFVHAEFMTHRVFSRNAASSRAIPAEKMMKMIREDPVMPYFWGKNKPGMQATEELNEIKKEKATELWLEARTFMVDYAERLSRIPVHKQIANRLVEPWLNITVIATATEHENFFSLRAHGDAQPEIGRVAYLMLDKYNKSTPKILKPGEWHIPFTDKYCEGLSLEQKLKIGTARVARVSYLNFEGKIDPAKDYDLHDRLKESGHWSPFEHAAKAMGTSKRYGNFKGWKQYRKQFNTENRTDSRVKKWSSEELCRLTDQTEK